MIALIDTVNLFGSIHEVNDILNQDVQHQDYLAVMMDMEGLFSEDDEEISKARSVVEVSCVSLEDTPDMALSYSFRAGHVYEVHCQDPMLTKHLKSAILGEKAPTSGSISVVSKDNLVLDESVAILDYLETDGDTLLQTSLSYRSPEQDFEYRTTNIQMNKLRLTRFINSHRFHKTPIIYTDIEYVDHIVGEIGLPSTSTIIAFNLLQTNTPCQAIRNKIIISSSGLVEEKLDFSDWIPKQESSVVHALELDLTNVRKKKDSFGEKVFGFYGYFSIFITALISNSETVLLLVGITWVTVWVDVAVLKTDFDNVVNTVDNTYYAQIFVGAIFASGTASSLKTIHHSFRWSRAVSLLHSNLLWTTLRGNLKFFQTYSKKFLLEIFGTKLDVFDEENSGSIIVFFEETGRIFWTCLLISAVNPEISVAAFVFCLLAALSGLVFCNSYLAAREVENSSWVDLEAFEEQFFNTTSSYRDKAFFKYYSAALSKCLATTQHREDICGWLKVRTGLLGVLMVSASGVLCLNRRDTLSGGWCGLILYITLRLADSVYKLVLTCAEFRYTLSSGTEFRDVLTNQMQEGELFSSQPEHQDWPSTGSLEIYIGDQYHQISDGQRYTMEVLNPSAFTASLFRLVENGEIKIFIAGTDIRGIGLFHLRSKIAVLRRFPMISGAEPEQIFDPFSDLEKDQLIEILNVCGIAGGAKDGEHFIQGQDRKIGLVQVLARKTKIVIMEMSENEEEDEMLKGILESNLATSTIVFLHTTL